MRWVFTYLSPVALLRLDRGANTQQLFFTDMPKMSLTLTNVKDRAPTTSWCPRFRSVLATRAFSGFNDVFPAHVSRVNWVTAKAAQTSLGVAKMVYLFASEDSAKCGKFINRMWAVTSRPVAILLNAIFVVVARSAEKKMLRIYAAAIVAMVANKHFIQAFFAVMYKPRNARRFAHSFANAENPISFFAT